MALSRGKLILIGLLLPVLIIALTAGVQTVIRQLRIAKANRLMDSFRETPPRETAEKLARLLGAEALPKEHGDAVLGALVQRRVVAHNPYAASEPLRIEIRNAAPEGVPFGELGAVYSTRVTLAGGAMDRVVRAGGMPRARTTGAFTVDLAPHVSDPGRYEGAVLFTFRLQRPRGDDSRAYFGPERPFPFNLLPGGRRKLGSIHPARAAVYESEQRIPFHLRVLPAEAAAEARADSAEAP